MERFVDLLNALAKYHTDVHSQQAAGRFNEAAQLSIEGKIDDAESRSADANRILGQARGVRRVWSSFIAQIIEMGGDEIPLAPLAQRLGATQQIIIPEQKVVETGSYQETQLPPAGEERQLQPSTPAPEVATVTHSPAESELTFFAPPEPEPVRQVIKAAQPPALAESGKIKRVDGDFGPKEEELAYALFAVNENKTDFAHESLEDAINSIYKDALESAVDKKDRARKRYGYMYRANQMLGNIEYKLKVAECHPDRIPHYLGQFLEWVKSQPEYTDIGVKEIVAIVDGEIKFEELQRGTESTLKLAAEPRIELPVEEPAPAVEAPTLELTTSPTQAEIDAAPPGQVDTEPEVASTVMKPEPLAEPASIEPLVAPVEPQLALATAEASTPEVGEKRIRGDITELEERVAYAFLAIDREKGGFLFNKRRDVVELIYQEQLRAIADPKERAKKISSLQGPIYQFAEKIMSKLRLASTRTDEVPHYTAELLKWINEQPEYANLSPEELETVLFRRVTFDTLQQRAGVQPTIKIEMTIPPSLNGLIPAVEVVETAPAPAPVIEVTAEQLPIEPIVEVVEEIGPQLSLSEAYLLAQRLSSLGAEVLTNLGIKLASDDREEVEATIARLSANPEASLDDPQAGLRLFKKLMAFAKDKQTIFMANEDEDVQYLLTLLAGVDSEDVIRKLSGAVPDVKKKTSLAYELEQEPEDVFDNEDLPLPTSTTLTSPATILEAAVVPEDAVVAEEPKVLVEVSTIITPPKPEILVPILNEREGNPPLTVDEFKRWVQRQVHMRRGDPDMILENGSQNAWKLFIDFDDFVLFEDIHLLIMNKPPRVNSHYSPKDPAGMEEIAKYRRGSNVLLAHRLDKDTTGIITLAKDMVSYWGLRNQFSNKADADVTKSI